MGGARVEVEVGYERFVIKGGKKSNEDTASVFLLGKELAYDTARGQVERLTTHLGKITKSDAKRWGTAVEAATNGQTVSQKVCGANGTSGGSTGTCGKNTDGANNGNKISVVFTEDATQLSAESNKPTIDVQGMANNINSLDKEGKAVVYQSPVPPNVVQMVAILEWDELWNTQLCSINMSLNR
nr:P44/Msp2 family outer membrane protein [Anaplasma centrale]